MSALRVLDLGSQGAFEARKVFDAEGPDAGRFLQGTVSGDLDGLELDRAICASLLSVKGRLQSELLIWRTDEAAFRLCAPRDTIEVARDILDRFLVMDDLELSPVRDFEGSLLVGDRERIDTLAHELGTGARRCEHPAPGLLLIDPEARAQVQGETFDFSSWTRHRVEQCRPSWGHELIAERLPPELGFGYSVSYEKGCYLGQEPLARLHARGRANWGLARIEALGSASIEFTPASEAVRLTSEAREHAGELTTWASGESGVVGLAIVHRKVIEAAAEVSCDAFEGPARVRELPTQSG